MVYRIIGLFQEDNGHRFSFIVLSSYILLFYCNAPVYCNNLFHEQVSEETYLALDSCELIKGGGWCIP